MALFWDSGSRAVVQHLPDHTKIEGSRPAPGTGNRTKNGKKCLMALSKWQWYTGKTYLPHHTRIEGSSPATAIGIGIRNGTKC
jgi:hypothetical protein